MRRRRLAEVLRDSTFMEDIEDAAKLVEEQPTGKKMVPRRRPTKAPTGAKPQRRQVDPD
jgi:hypothetical protein